MKTLLVILLTLAMVVSFSTFAFARSYGHSGHGSYSHGGYGHYGYGYRGHGGWYPGPFWGPPIIPYPYYVYPDNCWVPEHFEYNPNTGTRELVPGYYAPCN